VILKEGLPAGRLYLCQTARELRIMDIALLPPFRSAGIGAAILTRLQLDAQAQGVFVSIHVEKENPARSLYTRLGFKETEDREVYLLMVWAPPQPTGGAEDRHLGGQPAAHLERKTT
jgi:GNAT superfamily N-acetyltransferase